MAKADLKMQVLDSFRVDIKGLDENEQIQKELSKKWFLTTSQKEERDILEDLLPEIRNLEEEFNNTLMDFLKEKL